MHVRPRQTSTSRSRCERPPSLAKLACHRRRPGGCDDRISAAGPRPASKRAGRSGDFPAGDGLEGVRHRELVGGAGPVRLLVRSRHFVRAPPAALHRRRRVRGPTRRTPSPSTRLLRPSLQVAVGFLSLPHLGAELGIIVPMGVVAGRSPPNEDGGTADTAIDDREWTFANQGLGDIQVHPKLRFLNATRRGLGFADHAVGDPRHRRQELVPRRGADDLPADGDRRHRARLPRAGSAPPINAGMRIRGSTADLRQQRGQLLDPPTVPWRPHHHRRLDRGQERGDRRRRPVVRHRAAEVRRGRRAVRQLRPRLLAHQAAGGRARRWGRPPRRSARSSSTWRATRSSRSAAAARSRAATARRRRAAFVGFIFEPSIGDRDGDGYKDDVDQCPDDPEDFDDFEDEDGCPEPDNDKDGILDDRRQVPEQARDQERVPGRGRLPGRHDLRPRRRRHPRRRRQVPRRSRGQGRLRGRGRLPDPDNDKDGILDVDDLCPNDPEDKDGFEDQDGCPIRTTTRTGSSTSTTSARTSPRPTTASRTTTAARTRAGSSCARASSRSSTRSTSRRTRTTSSRSRSRCSTPSRRPSTATRRSQLIEIQGHADERGDDAHNLRSDRAARRLGPPRAGASATSSRAGSRATATARPSRSAPSTTRTAGARTAASSSSS